MRTSRFTVVASALNLILFLTMWVLRSLQPPGSGQWTYILYLCFGAIGLLLAVYGFVALTKGGEKHVKSAGILILLAFIPGCAVLIRLLTVLGGHPV